MRYFLHLLFSFCLLLNVCHGTEISRPPINDDEYESEEEVIHPEVREESWNTEEDIFGSGEEQVEIITQSKNESSTESGDSDSPEEPPTAVDFDVITTKLQLMTILRLSAKNSDSQCVDKNRVDCPVWAKKGFCDADFRYSIYMEKNCPESCKVCEEEKVDPLCFDTSKSCQNLKHYCGSDNFRTELKRSCSLTCGWCKSNVTTQQQQSEKSYSGTVSRTNADIEAEERTNKQWLAAIKATKNKLIKKQGQQQEVRDGDDMCFPKECGKSPIMEQYEKSFGARAKRSAVNALGSWDKLWHRMKRGADGSPVESEVDVVLKIVGGNRALRGQWPWHGMITQSHGRFMRFCGVTIICKRWLVTAAHCLVAKQLGVPDTRDKINKFRIFVARHAGLTNYNTHEHMQEFSRSQIEKFIVHPDYNTNPTYNNDIALIKLGKSITFTKYAQPVCIPKTNDLEAGDKLTTYGWGATKNRGPSGFYLKDISLPYIARDDCSKKLWGLALKNNICAGGNKYEDTCTGDSGGSLVKKDSLGRYNIYGITSYGNTNCNFAMPTPGVYTDVAKFYDWIKKETKGCCDDDDDKKKSNVVLKRRGFMQSFFGNF